MTRPLASPTRLYYLDSMQQSFDAVVVSSDRTGGRVEVVLDRTAFYPTSGGQPFDTGTLDGVRVSEVIDRDDGTIAHVVARELSVGARVVGAIDWPRRFDHMQQHTGQHLLSAAFDRMLGVRTVSVHMGAEASTIDLSREVSAAEIVLAEEHANRAVWDDHSVAIRLVAAEDAAGMGLRKPSARSGELRVVEIADVDRSACGGTHVPRTGMVGMVAVSSWERFKGGSRLSFVCGERARRSHGQLRDTVTTAARRLSVAPGELAAAIERLETELRAAIRARERVDREIDVFRADALREAAETIGGLRVVLRERPDWDSAALTRVAAAVVSAPGLVAVLVGGGDPAPVVIARSRDLAFDAGSWMRLAVERLGGRGGGRSEHAQGGLAASPETIVMFARSSLGSASV